jgi:hypothetical protein
MGIPLGLSTALFAGSLMVIGLQGVLFGVFGLLRYAQSGQVRRRNRLTRLFIKSFRLERGLAVGGIVLGLGVALSILTFVELVRVASPSSIDVSVTRLSILSTFVVLLGLQIMSFSFFLSLADLEKTLE